MVPSRMTNYQYIHTYTVSLKMQARVKNTDIQKAFNSDM